MIDAIKELLEWEEKEFGEIRNIRTSHHPISSSLFMIENTPEINERASKYNLSESELLVIVMLTGFYSDYVNGNLVKDKKMNQKIKDYLQSALLKLPKYSNNFDIENDPREYIGAYSGDYLYRRLNYLNEKIYFIDNEFISPVSLTTSIENYGAYNSDTVILEIKPLPNKTTKARKVYLIRDHYDETVKKNPDIDISKEWQVNFEFNTKFRVTDIKKQQEKTGEKISYTLISIEELES